MAQAKIGDTVRVHYRGSLEDGTVFDSSFEREPLELTLGQGLVIPGFENAVVGMEEGDTKPVTILPEDGFGQYREDLVVVIERSQIPPHINPQPGMTLQLRSDEGMITELIVTDIDEDTITLDANHPLAGERLIFEITLLEIV
ncbi:MAG: peptidylprolyl isomerase [candidate division KSB1 bacterium]|nr:peptidylprolyl isomerase [candidate division KSB1 bacterium]